ncbi:MAG: PAS domain-containing protein [Candidatus Omnitrophica bacterium]|nr:PAS domain-containing protein [Candidatus Omnitrophota bacterium]
MEYKKNMTEQEVRNALEYAENIINAVREPLLILDGDLRVVSASKSFYDFFKVKSEETEKQRIYDLGNHQWDIPKLRELLEEIIPKNAAFYDFEVKHDFPVVGERIMMLNARRIPMPPEKPRIILLAIEDVTGNRMLQKLHEKMRDLEIHMKASLANELKIIGLEDKIEELREELDKIRKL